MSSTIDYSISLTQQPTWIFYEEYPTARFIDSIDYEIDNSKYEEYSFTGKRSEVEKQQQTEFDSLYNAETATWASQIQATITRLNGDLWELKIRKNRIRKREDDSEATQEQQDAMEDKYGSQKTPKTISTEITAIQENILNHPKFANVPPDNLAAIKQYMNGAGPGEVFACSLGSAVRLGDLMSLEDELVQFAIKNPTYYVPSMTVTYQYWSNTKNTDMSDVGTIKAPPGSWSFPEGYTSLFMGRSSSPVEVGYTIQETYTIGKFNSAPYMTD